MPVIDLAAVGLFVVKFALFLVMIACVMALLGLLVDVLVLYDESVLYVIDFMFGNGGGTAGSQTFISDVFCCLGIKLLFIGFINQFFAVLHIFFSVLSIILCIKIYVYVLSTLTV